MNSLFTSGGTRSWQACEKNIKSFVTSAKTGFWIITTRTIVEMNEWDVQNEWNGLKERMKTWMEWEWDGLND
jgi:hypothetical protein